MEHDGGQAAGGAGPAGAAAEPASVPPFVPAFVPAFLGTHQPRMDDKGRLFLPAKFRQPLAGGLVITRGQERCLYVFPQAEFARLYTLMRQARVSPGRAGRLETWTYGDGQQQTSRPADRRRTQVPADDRQVP